MTSSLPNRVAFCITELDPGGAERAFVQLVLGLDRSRWEPAVYCLGKPASLVKPLSEAGIPVKCYSAQSWRDLLVIVKLARDLRKFRPRLLQTFMFHANLIGRIAGKLAGVRRIVAGLRVAEKQKRWHLRLDRLTQCLVDRYVCVSESVRHFSRDVTGLPARKLVVIRNGVDVDIFAHATPADLTSLGIPAGRRVLISVGRLDPQKGTDVLLSAFTLLCHAFPSLDIDCHLLLVGEGPLRVPLESLAHQLGIQDRVTFAGQREDVPALLAASDLFVLSSRWEGLPNALLEALAAGLPGVVTEVEGVRELVEGLPTYQVVSPNSPRELAEAIRRLLGNIPTHPHADDLSHWIDTKGFTWHSMVASYEALYTKLSPEAGAAG